MRRARRALGAAVSFGVLLASIGADVAPVHASDDAAADSASAMRLASQRATALIKTETIQSIGDATGDSIFPQGDIVGAAALADSDGVTAVAVTVTQWETPFTDNWQLGLTGVGWDFDVDGDGTVDFDVTLFAIGGQVVAEVTNEADAVVCQALPTWDQSLQSYAAAFATSCLGNPASFRWRAAMAYENAVTLVQSSDSAPDVGWTGPVLNDAHPANQTPCTPGTISPPGAAADGFVSLVPARLLDTRLSSPTIDCQFDGIGRIGGVVEVALQVTGRGGVPLGATAAVLNVTVTGGVVDGFITAYPCGEAMPQVSNLNYETGETVPNAIIATLSADGRVCLFSNASVHLIADVNGYFTAGSSYVPTTPSRFDTRNLGGPRPAGSVTTVGGDGAVEALVLNVTVVSSNTAGYATVYPCGTAPPLASNLNFQASEAVSNLVVAATGAGGGVCVYLSADAHLVVDRFGSFTAGAGFTSLVPARLLETRSGLATFDGLANGTGLVVGPRVVQLQVGGRGNVPLDATAAVLNVTVDDARGDGFITVFPCGSAQPTASSLNYVVGSTVPNAVITRLGPGGTVCFYSNASTHLVVDVNGYFPAA